MVLTYLPIFKGEGRTLLSHNLKWSVAACVLCLLEGCHAECNDKKKGVGLISGYNSND